MAVATTRTIALQGATGHLIDVQVDVSPGMVATIMVGRPDAAISEARDRCRMAVANSGFAWPTTRRTTILLSPADLPKRGTHLDLAIAVAVLAAAVDPRKDPPIPTDDALFLGELTLAGALRPVPGVLPMVLAAASHGIRRVFVPEPQAAEAALVPDVAVFGMRSLAQVVAELRGVEVPDAPPVAPESGSRLLSWRGQERLEEGDLADLVGVGEAVYAAEVAAAGGHHLLLRGPKGSGKTTLAERIPSILPDLDHEEALELTAIHSLAGGPAATTLIRRPPYLAPHHGASQASILGGGSGRARPGAVSRAHSGVLFLDEFPLFSSTVVQGLREPLESGEVTIARGEETATFPARAMVVLAANPCPCGERDSGTGACTCPSVKLRTYQEKLEGPVADRVDIVRDVRPPPRGSGPSPGYGTTSAQARARVTAARRRQAERYAGASWRLNGHAPGAALRSDWPLDAASADLVEARVDDGLLTRRGATRVHRLAWTVADLAGRAAPELPDVRAALALRLGDPLPAALVERAG